MVGNGVTGGSPDERYLVVSADCHVGPPIEELEPWLDPGVRDDFRGYLAQIHAFHAVRSAQASATAKGAIGRALGAEGQWDPTLRIRDLEAEGIVAEVAYPNTTIGIPFSAAPSAMAGLAEPEPRLQAAGARAYNRWLEEFCGTHPGRVAGIGAIQVRDVDAAVAEIERCRQGGLFGGVLLPHMPLDAGYNDPAYEPLWSACEALEMPLNSHSFPRLGPHAAVPEGFALALVEGPLFAQRTLWYLIFAGVFERHPGLKLVFAEQGADWVPGVLDRMDLVHSRLGSSPARAKAPWSPRKYWAQNCHLGATFMKRSESNMRDSIGVGRIMWGSDYPHPEGTCPYTRESLREAFAGLPVAEVRGMLGENAIACYGFDTSLLRPLADRFGPPVSEVARPLDTRPEDVNLTEMGSAFTAPLDAASG